MEHESDGDTNCNWCSWNDLQRLGKVTGRVGNERTSRHHPNYGIVKIGQDYSFGIIMMIIIIIKKICKIFDFAVPADHRIKQKECEKKDKYLDLTRELKKLWDMKVTIIPIVIGAFGTVTKGLLKGLEDLEVVGRVETIQTTALLKTARILRRVLET